MPDEIRPGPMTPDGAASLDARLRRLEELLAISAAPPLQLSFDGGGPRLSYDQSREGFWVQITSGTNPYDWTEQRPIASGGFENLIAGRSGTTTDNPLFEANGRTIETPAYVWAWPGYFDRGSAGLTYLFDSEAVTSSAATVYRDECVGGAVLRSSSTITLAAGRLSQSAWVFDSFQGCCVCSGGSGSGFICCGRTMAPSICFTITATEHTPSPDWCLLREAISASVILHFDGTLGAWFGSYTVSGGGTFLIEVNCAGDFRIWCGDTSDDLHLLTFGIGGTYDCGPPWTWSWQMGDADYVSTVYGCCPVEISPPQYLFTATEDTTGCGGGSGSGSGSGGGGVSTNCCPGGLPATLYATVVGCSGYDGTYAMTYQANAVGSYSGWVYGTGGAAGLHIVAICIGPPWQWIVQAECNSMVLFGCGETFGTHCPVNCSGPTISTGTYTSASDCCSGSDVTITITL